MGKTGIFKLKTLDKLFFSVQLMLPYTRKLHYIHFCIFYTLILFFHLIFILQFSFSFLFSFNYLFTLQFILA